MNNEQLVFYKDKLCRITAHVDSHYDLETVKKTERGIIEQYLSVHQFDCEYYVERRMYFFVLYSLSGIQQGIQAGHAAVEYAYQFGDSDAFRQFALRDKTFILLNGGTSHGGNFSGLAYPELGGMELLENTLTELEDHYRQFHFAAFREPDLNDSLTALAFIAEDRVYNKEKYPDFDKWVSTIIDVSSDSIHTAISEVLSGDNTSENPWSYETQELHHRWVDGVMHGYLNVKLRNLLNGKKWA